MRCFFRSTSKETYKCLVNQPFSNVLTVFLAMEEEAIDENDFVATILQRMAIDI